MLRASVAFTLVFLVTSAVCFRQFSQRALRSGAVGQRSRRTYCAAQEDALADEEDAEFGPMVVLHDPESGRSIQCIQEFETVINGNRFVVGTPADTPATICTFNEEGGLEPADTSSQVFEEMVAMFEAALEEYNLILLRTAVTLTISGEMDMDEDMEGVTDDEYDDDEDDEYEDGSAGGIPEEGFEVKDAEPAGVEDGAGDEDGEDDEDDEDWRREDEMFDDEEEVDLVAALEWEGVRYNLVQLLEPVLIVGKQNPETKAVEIPSSAELDEVYPLIEARMEASGAGPGGEE